MNNNLQKQLLKRSKAAKLERLGKTVSFLALMLITLTVFAIIIFVASKGLSTFFYQPR